MNHFNIAHSDAFRAELRTGTAQERAGNTAPASAVTFSRRSPARSAPAPQITINAPALTSDVSKLALRELRMVYRKIESKKLGGRNTPSL